MISSSTVNSDSSSLKSLFSNYSSAISSISSSDWEGASKDNLDSNVNNMISTYPSAIEKQMTDFASAIDKYSDYKTAKQNMETALSNKNSATDESTKSSYESSYNTYKGQVDKLNSEIKELLSSVKSGKLDDAVTTLESKKMSLDDFVYYRQGDYKQSYGYGSTIASAGCGPTAMAMVLTYLTGRKISPVEAANWSMKHGYRIKNNGTSTSYFEAIAKAYGIKCQAQNPTANNIINSLKQGNVIVAHMGPGEFTSGGHYITLIAADNNGNVLVRDPATPNRNKWYKASLIQQQSKGSMFVCNE